MGRNDIGAITRRLGLKGALVRWGEKWRTSEIKAFQSDISTLNKKHFHLNVEDMRDDKTLNDDILELLKIHGPLLWPKPDAKKGDDRSWLFHANDPDAPGYTTDFFYNVHRAM